LAERALFDAHVDRVFRLAYRMTGDEDLAREFTQDAFVRAFNRLDGFRGDSAFGTWIHSVTVSAVLDGLRKRKRRRDKEVEVEDPSVLAPPARREHPGLRHRLNRAIDDLSGILKAVFVMHDIEGYKHPEIAEILGVPEGTSRARLARAREQLRRALGSVTAAEEGS
jgi:RNA polymerase sigma-70 factor (ECF subfamily)